MIWAKALTMQDSKTIGLKPVICIAGPTASGKSGLAIELAKAVDGEIINADAMQVYRDIRILSARPDEEEKDGVPHHLFGHVDGKTLYSVGDWSREAVPIILDVLARGRVPILAGGTGLYFQALLEGLAEIPPVPDTLEAELSGWPVQKLRDVAETLDPMATAKVLGDDPQRLARIVSVAKATGRPLSEWRAATRPIIPKGQTIRAVLLPDREALYARINQRFEKMIGEGALGEARDVYAKTYPPRASMPKAIGLSHLLSHLDGECDLDIAIEIAKRDTRRLAKRQMTWFRNRCGDWDVLRTKSDQAQWKDSVCQRV